MTSGVPQDEYKVSLDVFEGPLDLLLYLIRRDEVDIYDIPIERITTATAPLLAASAGPCRRGEPK